MRNPLIIVLTLLTLLALTTAAAQTPADTAITNPLAVSPTVLLAGELGEGAEGALEARGIHTVIDLRTPEEGTEEARRRFEAAGFRYVNFPTTGIAPDRERLAEFTALLDAESHAPLILHCASGNRAGMMWALYSLAKGAAREDVLREVAPIVTKDPLREEIVRYAAPVLPR